MKRILLFGKPVTFGSKVGTQLSSTVTSRRAYIRASSSAAISVTGGQYSLDGGATWTSGAGTRGTYPYLLARGTSSASYLTGTTITVTIGGTGYPFYVTTRAEDTTPDSFSFTSISGVELSTATSSNTITITGIDTTASLAVTATSLQYSKNGGAYTASAGSVVLNDTLQVKLTSSGSYSTAVSGTLTVSGTLYTFSATTRDADITPNAFTFTDVTGAELSTLTTSTAITIAGIEAPAPFTVAGGEAEKNGSGTWETSGTVANGDTVKVRTTSSSSYSTGVDATLSISGVSDAFTVTTKAYVPPGSGFPYTLPFALG